MASPDKDYLLDIRNEPLQPILQFPKRTFGNHQRSFSASWYERYPWLHYVQEINSVLCFYCASAVKRKINISCYVDKTFSENGFNNWQKALKKFEKHQLSQTHLFATKIFIEKCNPTIDELLISLSKNEILNQNILFKILSSIRFLAKQGLPFRGHYIDDSLQENCEQNSNLFQLLKLRQQDVSTLESWILKAQDKFISPSIQNEMLEIMSLTVLRKISLYFADKQYTIMVDETTDISNPEQLAFCIRYVDDELFTHEKFIGLYSLESTCAKNLIDTIEDILLRFSLPINNCRGQCYDGAAAMAGHKSGVSTVLLSKKPRALYTHCYGHALNLAIQDMVKSNLIMRNTLDTVEEMTKLIKKSPKSQVIFEKMRREITLDSPRIRLLAPTRWTVRANALSSISQNYIALKETWSISQGESRDSEMRARIGGVSKQMESFDFLFGVELGLKVLSMADNLSSTLQGSHVSACEGQRIMNITISALQSIRSEESFTLFWGIN